MEDTISFLSKRTYVRNLGYDIDDLKQEGRLKVLLIYKKNKKIPFESLAALCHNSLVNFYSDLVRKSKAEKYDAIVVDISDAFSISDNSSYENILLNSAISKLKDLLTDDEIMILDLLLNPNKDLVDLAHKVNKDLETKQIKLSLRVLSSYLNMNRNKVNRMMEKIRGKVPLAIKMCSCQSLHNNLQ